MKMTQEKQAQIDIDGEITSSEWRDSDTSAAGFRDDLKALGDIDVINLHINSPGGEVFEGIAIYNMLKQHKAYINVYVDGLAASIASVIAMAGDTVYMPENSMLMLHNPSTIVFGNADDLRKEADDLDKITQSVLTSYLDKAGDKLEEEQLSEILDNETWLSASEAIDFGLADEVLQPNKAVACLSAKFKQFYNHIPTQLVQDKTLMNDSERQKIINEAKKHKEITKNILGGIL